MSLGVLPDVEGRDVEPESPDKATDTAKKPVGNGLAAIGRERVTQEPELIDEFVDVPVVLAQVCERCLPASRARVFTSRWRM